ncbi:MAG: phage tail protein [Blastomonas sp.]
MSKVVRVVAAVGLVVAGVATGNLALVGAGISIGASTLQKIPKAPKASPETIERLNASIDPRTPRKIVWGDTAGATDIRDHEYTDNQTYLHRFIVVASHKVHSIYEIWFDDKKAWDSASGVTAEYSGYLTVAPILEGNAGNAINISARMGATRRFTGLAYVHLRFKLTGNTKKTDSPFAQSVPSRVTIRTRGALVYDPRKDSTVPGGSGAHRADDQTTWEWDDDAARNPALQMLWWMLGWKIEGKLAVGGGIPPVRIDLESFITAANLCDEDVALAAGGTEPRYRSDGVVSEGDGPTVIMDSLKVTMNADLDDVGGKLRLFVFHNDLATPVADFDEDDIIGAFEYRGHPALDETFNVVRGTYTDPRDVSLYQQIDYPQVELPSRDGIDRIDTFALAMVQSPSQAQRLAKQRLQRQQYGGVFTTTGQATWWKAQKNSVVRLTFAPRGWTNKLFRVSDLDHRVDGTVPITLREENAAIYVWDAEESPPVAPVNPSEYDFALNPIVAGIDEASVTDYDGGDATTEVTP